jgi:hypothetical protein
MKEIVAEEKESSVNAAPVFEFNQLSTLLLWYLGKLKGFYAKNHTLACPSLKIIDVIDCAKLNLYRPLSTRSSNLQDDKLSVLTQEPPFIVEEVCISCKLMLTYNNELNKFLFSINILNFIFSPIKFLHDLVLQIFSVTSFGP